MHVNEKGRQTNKITKTASMVHNSIGFGDLGLTMADDF